MSGISKALRSELRDPEYSEGYAESFLNSYIATQIKVIREQRKLTQADVAKEMGTTQTAISRIENVNYPAWNIKTLKKLARAFHVRLRVSFETYGTLPWEVDHFTREALQRAPREEDPGLLERIGPQREENSPEEGIALAMFSGVRNLPGCGNLTAFPKPEQVPFVPVESHGGLYATFGSVNS